jgi:LysM repeat protein
MSVESRLAEIESRLGGSIGPMTQTGPKLPVAPPVAETYVIRDGDSLGGIARKFGIPRQALLDANNMAEGQPIYIGETLVIPSAPDNNPGPVAGDGVIHIVKAGDTLTGISRKYGTSIAMIKQSNGLNSDVIGTGQKLVIPAIGAQVSQGGIGIPASPPQNQNASAGGKYQYDNPMLESNETYGYYSVQKGDNLYALARDFFTTMSELQRLNNLGSSTIIHPGHELIVPTSKYNDYHQNVAQN